MVRVVARQQFMCLALGIHRHRKMFKVGWAQHSVAREIFTTTPTFDKPRPFLHDRDCYCEFLDEKMNCKSNGIDLEAIETHSLIIATAD